MNKRLILILGSIIAAFAIFLCPTSSASAASKAPTVQTVKAPAMPKLSISSLSATPSCNAQLRNPGFESGLDQWTMFSDSPGSTYGTAQGVASNRSARVRNYDYYAYTGARQAVCTEPNRLYKERGKMLTMNVTLNPDDDGDANAFILGANYGVTSADPSVVFPSQGYSSPSLAGNHGWTWLEVTLSTKSARAVNVEGRMGVPNRGGGSYGEVNFDLITFQNLHLAC